MPMFSGKSEEEKQQRDASKQLAKAEKERESHRKRFLSTPLGQAAQAFEAGDGFLQLERSARRVQRDYWATDGTVKQKRLGLPTDELSQVESVGWHLEHVSHVYVMTNQRSRDKLLSSGQEVGIEGEVVGYYLFRRDETRRHQQFQNRTVEEIADSWSPD